MAFWKGKEIDPEHSKAKEPEQDIRGRSWIWLGIGVCVAVSTVFVMLYGMFRLQVEDRCAAAFATEENAGWLYQNTYLLYRDLYNSQNQVQESYVSLYLEPEEGYVWLTDKNLLDKYIVDEGVTGNSEQYGESVGTDFAELEYLSDELSCFQGLFASIEDTSGTLNGLYGHVIRDDSTGYYLTNMSDGELQSVKNGDFFRLSFTFDNVGNVTVTDAVSGSDEITLRLAANQAVRDTMRLDQLMTDFLPYGTVGQPRNCTVTYYVPYEKWKGSMQQFYQLNGLVSGTFRAVRGEISHYTVSGYYRVDDHWLYMDAGMGGFLLFFALAVLLAGLFLPLKGSAPWREKGACTLSIEFLVMFGLLLTGCISLIVGAAAAVAGGGIVDMMSSGFFPSRKAAYLFVMAGDMALNTLFFFGAWYIGVSLRVVREMGLWGYIKRSSLIYRFFPFIRRQVRKVYGYFLNMDLTENAGKTILRIVAVNAIILSLISALWLGGLMVTAVYSVILYIILRKYVSDLQKRYRILLEAVDEMAGGNLNVTIEEDLGVFEPFKPQVIKIQSGFRKAVEDEVKSQHMKAELITNVSHDLKTPLTAIITYVNLLKDESLSVEKRREYLDTLEQKSLRLKVLIEDLFEVSKATSGNVTLNLMPVDIMSLIKQVCFEMKDKLDEAQLDVRMNLTDEKVVLTLDSQKTYRIYENLFGNIAKYALRGTRVYINGFRIDDTVVITFKNISAEELTVDSSELTERFVRGDASRNTEGSGLGLAITKSFTELQGGELRLEVDGDLFKATTIWHL